SLRALHNLLRCHGVSLFVHRIGYTRHLVVTAVVAEQVASPATKGIDLGAWSVMIDGLFLDRVSALRRDTVEVRGVEGSGNVGDGLAVPRFPGCNLAAPDANITLRQAMPCGLLEVNWIESFAKSVHVSLAASSRVPG